MNKTGNGDTYVNNPSSEWQVAKATSGVGWGKVMYEATLAKVDKPPVQKHQPFVKGTEFVPAPQAQQTICSCRFGWATNDSEDDTAISGIFYGNGKQSHIVMRSKDNIQFFSELEPQDSFLKSDIISTGIDFENNVAWFARNGKKVGDAKGYPLPDFLQKRKLFPVVGLQNSAVQLNFGKPRKRVPGTEDFVTVDQHKMISKTDYLWATRPPVEWNNLFEGHPAKVAAIPIFTWLNENELKTCTCVCKDWKRLIEDAYLFQRTQLRCCVLRTSFEEGLLGLGIIIENNGNDITRVTTSLEYFSYNAWQKHGHKTGPSKKTNTHFLPLIINQEHAKRAIPAFKSLLNEYLPGEEEIKFNSEGVLHVLTSLMNGTIVTLASDEDEPSPELIQNQVELYCHLHHMLLFLNYDTEYNLGMGSLVDSQITSALEDTTLLEKDKISDIGTFLLKTGISRTYNWKTIRKPVLLELFDRDVPKYLVRYPELEFYDENEKENPQDRLQKVMDCTVFDRRKIMVQTYFCCQVNRKCANPVAQLDAYNQIYGHPDSSVIRETITSLGELYGASDWASYFERLYLKPQDDQFVKNILVESMGRAKQKNYYEPSYITPAQPYEEEVPQNDVPPQEEYEETPLLRKEVHDFHMLVDPLAACLKDACEPLPLQKDGLPSITSGKETLVLAPHGTGKHTLAAISIIHTLLVSDELGCHVWVLVTDVSHAYHFAEILRDVYTEVGEDEMSGAVRKLPVNIALAVNPNAIPQHTNPNTPCVFVGTPPAIKTYLHKNYIHHGKLQAVYILEADLLLTTKGADIEDIFRQVPQDKQCVVMSSTVSTKVDDELAKILEAPALIKKEYSTRVRHWYVACIMQERKTKMFELLCREMKFTQAIVYISGSSGAAQKLKNALQDPNEVGLLTGSTSHQDRRDIVERFNKQEIRMIMMSDLIAPYGIKIDKVDCLIHVDVPQTKQSSIESPIEAYGRRLSIIEASERVIESISFSLRHNKVEKFLHEVDNKYTLKELPADPNSLEEEN